MPRASGNMDHLCRGKDNAPQQGKVTASGIDLIHNKSRFPRSRGLLMLHPLHTEDKVSLHCHEIDTVLLHRAVAKRNGH